MRYIDEKLSTANLMLLNAWIDRRESRKHYPDVRSERDREWWNYQQAMRRFTQEKQDWQYLYSQQNSLGQQSAMNQCYQSSLTALGLINAYGIYQQKQ